MMEVDSPIRKRKIGKKFTDVLNSNIKTDEALKLEVKELEDKISELEQ